MGLTPVYNWPYPELNNPPDGATQMKNLALAIEPSLKTTTSWGIHQRSFGSAVWPCPNNAYTDIVWETGGGTPFVCPVKGLYIMCGLIMWTAATPPARILRWTTTQGVPGGAVGYTTSAALQTPAATAIASFNAGTTIALQAYQNSGAPLNLGTASGYSSGMSIMWLPLP